MDTSILEKAFFPKSIAVVGASSNPAKLGHLIVKAVTRGGFDGKVYPVNVNERKILHLKAYRSVLEIPGEVDLALIAIPAELVPNAIKECGQKGIEIAVVFSAGFGETRGGVKLEEELVSTASRFGVRIIGPNTNGLINLNANLNATFGPDIDYETGIVAFVCQSGGYSSVLLRYGSSEGVGFSKVINLGNSSDISFADVLDFLATDEHTRAVVLYVEGFKRENEGRRFFNVIKKVTMVKPVIAFKVGKTDAGRRAVRSHTGSLAGSDELYSAAFKQAGVIKTTDGVEMIDAAKALSLQHNLSKGKRVAILTNLGGPGVVAADVCEANGLVVGELSKRTKERLSERLSTTASLSNPIDLAADWPHLHVYKEVLSTLLEDVTVDAVIIVIYVTPQSKYRTLLRDIVTVSEKQSKPMVACCLSSDETARSKCIQELQKHSIPCYGMPERAAKAMVHIVQYSTHRKSVI